MAQMTAAQVEALLAHELAHIRRRDYAINLLQTVAEALLFFHPAVWWISRRIRQEREHCCDDAAIAVAGEATAYAEALMALASWREREFQPSMGAAKGSLLLRIRRLLSAADGDQDTGARRAPATRSRRRARRSGDGAGGSLGSGRTGWRAARGRGPARSTDRSLRDLLHAGARSACRAHCRRGGARLERVSGRPAPQSGLQDSARPVRIGRRSQRGRPTVAANVSTGAGDRIVFNVDVPADQWQGLLTHEVTHVFGFDIIPGQATPAWIAEGLAEHRAERLGIPTTSCSFARRFGRNAGPADHVLPGREFQAAAGRGARACGLRLHRVAVGQGRRSPVPAGAAPRRHRGGDPDRSGVPDACGGLRSRVRDLSARAACQRRRRRRAARLDAAPPVQIEGRSPASAFPRAQPGVHRAPRHRCFRYRAAVGHRSAARPERKTLSRR